MGPLSQFIGLSKSALKIKVTYTGHPGGFLRSLRNYLPEHIIHFYLPLSTAAKVKLYALRGHNSWDLTG